MKPPGSLSELERRVSKYAREAGTTPDRVRHWISYMIFCGLLDHAIMKRLIPTYFIKGGVALELRFGQQARATQDLDLGIVAPVEKLVSIIEKILPIGYDQFTFRRKTPPELLPSGVYRLQVAISYASRAWGTLPIDVTSSASVTTDEINGISLDPFGLRGPSPIPCLCVAEQIAQKIHALTEPPLTKNNRFRDLVDVITLANIIDDFSAVGTACKRTFTARNTHEWPPTFDLPHTWKEPVTRMAQDHLPMLSLNEIIAKFKDIILQADQARM